MISIIITAYKEPRTIGRAIESILENNLKEINNQMILTQNSLEQLKAEALILNNELLKRNDLSEAILSKKEKISSLTQQERMFSIRQVQLQTQIANLMQKEQELKKILDELNVKKIQLLRVNELYNWLENHFIKLTYTLEKELMLGIHQQFNQLFQDWFGLLVTDENVYSRLDDSFTPIIEQNGYEVAYSNLSGGERTSAALAYRLALNKVINDVVSEIKTKDLLILDEPTDGFSSEQLDKVREVLDRIGLKQIIIVSHESKIESFVENVIRIGKSGHVSKVM